MKIVNIFFGLCIISLAFCPVSFSGNDTFNYDPKETRDPFLPLIDSEGKFLIPLKQVTSVSDIKLEGIVWDTGGKSLAIINGDMVQEGDLIGGNKIEKIFPDRVIILVDEKETVLYLLEEEQTENENL
ncbi:MAG: hypothetical protein ABH836_03590 [Candidatus Omnitrophota bacterium]